MPIRIPDELPARRILEQEGVAVLNQTSADRQDIRPLRIALLNLMPNKIKTETQFARLIGATPLQVELSLIKITGHTPKNTSQEHMLAFYESWEDVKHQRYDGLIITGAPIEQMPFEDVTYWNELSEIYQWTQTNVQSTFNICWAAQASLYHFYKMPKRTLAQKAFGIYAHKNNNPASPLLRGFADDFAMPVSRWTESLARDLPQNKNLEILMESDEAGLCLVNDPVHRMINMFNHIEYDTGSLGDEYFRDVEAGKTITMPINYFPNDNPKSEPQNRWRAHAHLLFGNWINELYQSTPFDLNDIGKVK
jgi:homoserine O-succinyltransferase/O-acetyltransferase